MPRRDSVDPTDTMVTCPECEGTGLVPDPYHAGESIVCPVCNGTGRCTQAQADRSRTRRRRINEDRHAQRDARRARRQQRRNKPVTPEQPPLPSENTDTE